MVGKGMTESTLTSDWDRFKEFSRRTLDASSSIGNGVFGVYVVHESHSRHVFCRPSEGEVWGTLIVGDNHDVRTLPEDDPLTWFDFLRGS
jgi:hypothetical protein